MNGSVPNFFFPVTSYVDRNCCCCCCSPVRRFSTRLSFRNPFVRISPVPLHLSILCSISIASLIASIPSTIFLILSRGKDEKKRKENIPFVKLRTILISKVNDFDDLENFKKEKRRRERKRERKFQAFSEDREKEILSTPNCIPNFSVSLQGIPLFNPFVRQL